MTAPLTWPELEALTTWPQDEWADRTNGPTNAQARLRLFGHDPAGGEAGLRVTLYRDNHAWCPYCQKVWLWLEEKQIPYRIEKVTMFCYGEKESWYKRIVPSGMLPALALDGRMITESDDILIALESAFGPLTYAMEDPKVLPLRRLERLLFRAWCNWLCRPASLMNRDGLSRQKFQEIVDLVEAALAATPGPYFLDQFSSADVIFTPYVERMNASLYYYKGYNLRDNNPRLGDWFDAMETRTTYRGTQSDFHTHSHDLPPQMGGCYGNGEPEAQRCAARVDQGPWAGLPDGRYAEPETSRAEALARVIKHRENIIRVNPVDDTTFDEALRCGLTRLMMGDGPVPPQGAEVGLRYLRDRINVPRDMSIYAARRLRQALEDTAALVSDRPGPPIPVRNRYDQNPQEFAIAP